jgi:hypothetical protein
MSYSNFKINELNGKFKNFIAGYSILISGSGSNNGVKTIASVDSKDYVSFTSPTIQFNQAANGGIQSITNNSGGFDFVGTDDLIKVSGSTISTNNTYWLVDSANGTQIFVGPGLLTSTPQQTATIQRGNNITIDQSVTLEIANATATVTVAGKKVAQHFTLENNINWLAHYILINCKKVGTPTDNLVLQLCTASGIGNYTVIETITIAGANISTEYNNIRFNLAGTTTLNYGTNYALVISRSGSDNESNFFSVGIDEGMKYTRGFMYLYNGSTWALRTTNAQLPFQIWGKLPIETQISNILTEIGQFIPTFEISASGQSSEQYIEKEELADSKIKNLMELGTSTNKRYLSTTQPTRHIRFYPEPTLNSSVINYTLMTSSKIVNKTQQKIEPGLLIFGEFIKLDSKLAMQDSLASISTFFVEESEFNINGNLKLTPRNALSYSDLDIIQLR